MYLAGRRDHLWVVVFVGWIIVFLIRFRIIHGRGVCRGV